MKNNLHCDVLLFLIIDNLFLEILQFKLELKIFF